MTSVKREELHQAGVRAASSGWLPGGAPLQTTQRTVDSSVYF